MTLQEGVAPEHEWRQLKGDATLLSILRSKLWGTLGLSGAWHQSSIFRNRARYWMLACTVNLCSYVQSSYKNMKVLLSFRARLPYAVLTSAFFDIHSCERDRKRLYLH
jgi:hypothetical protein